MAKQLPDTYILYSSPRVNRHTQLRNGGFCWQSFTAHMPQMQLAHSEQTEDARVLLHHVTHIYFKTKTRFTALYDAKHGN